MGKIKWGAYIEIAPIFRPEFLRDLLEILGEPSSVKFSISGKEISEEAIKIGELEGVKLEDRYIGGAPVRLEGKASIEKILEIYAEQYEYFRLTFLEEKRRFGEVNAPRIGIEEIYWRKWKSEEGGGYSIKFDEYNLEIDISPEEEKIISDLVKSAKKHNVGIRINLRQR
jgi:hypothetical protein